MKLRKYDGREGEGKFRLMTAAEVRQLGYGDHIWFLDLLGDARRAKVNGKVRTWKRSPEHLEIPLKYGMYEYFTFSEQDVAQGRLLAEV